MSFELLTTRDVRGRYYLALEQATGVPWVDLVANSFESDQAAETYPFIGQVPQMREWVGGRHAKSFNDDSVIATNVHYEATVDVPYRFLRRDKTGQIDTRLSELAQRPMAHKAKLLSDLIVTGETATCYDGDTFFGTAHSEGDSGTQSNDISVDISAQPAETSGTITNPSVEEMQFAIGKGIQQIVSFVDDRGEPMNENAREFLVMVPSTLQQQALTAVALPSQITASQSGLSDMGVTIRVATNVRLNATWDDAFPIFRTDRAIKALIFQEEVEPQMKMKWLDSDYFFDNDAVEVGVDSWRTAIFGFWQNACLVTMT